MESLNTRAALADTIIFDSGQNSANIPGNFRGSSSESSK